MYVQRCSGVVQWCDSWKITPYEEGLFCVCTCLIVCIHSACIIIIVCLQWNPRGAPLHLVSTTMYVYIDTLMQWYIVCMYVVKHCTYVCIPVHVNTILFKQFTNIQERFLQTNKFWTPGLIRTLDKFSTVCAWIRLDSTFAECHQDRQAKKNQVYNVLSSCMAVRPPNSCLWQLTLNWYPLGN